MLPRCLALMLVCLTSAAHAVPPPNLPLPPCVDADGDKTGACPVKDPAVEGSAVGRLSFNSAVGAYVEPQVPPCHSWDANGTGDWSPTPCYRGVDKVEIVGCAYRTIDDDSFVETECTRALLAQGTSPGGNLFEVGAGESGSCGGEGNFWVYALGGPATDPNAIWSARGPTTTKCQVRYLGPRPDGLWGPTWVILRATINLMTGPTASDFGRDVSSEFYLPIDGDLRDLGPIAAFSEAANEGGRVAFSNDSVHTRGEAMTYRWDFGDDETSSEAEPEHRYRAPGTYRVTLTVRDSSGDEDDVTLSVRVDLSLVATLEVDDDVAVGEPLAVTLTVRNPFEADVEGMTLIGPHGLRFEAGAFIQTAGPSPSVPERLAGGASVTFTFELEPQAPGRTTIEAGAQAWLDDVNVSDTDSKSVLVPARLAIELTTSVTSETKLGDDFTVTATITNNEDVAIEGISSDRLELEPSDIVTLVSGPTSDGADPRVAPITLEPGASTTITWVYDATQKGTADLRALVSGRDPNTDALFYVSDTARVAIETPAFDVTNLRFEPSTAIPGMFGIIRGTLTNIGSRDITDIDYAFECSPKITVIDRILNELPAEVAPKKARLDKEQHEEFVIPWLMETNAGELGSWKLKLTFTGMVELDGTPTEITYTKELAGPLDLTEYHTNLRDQLRAWFIDTTTGIFDELDDISNKSTIGGTIIGGSEGVVGALQLVGDGLLDTGELVVNTATGKYKLTEKGEQLARVAIDYYTTRSPKEWVGDVLDLGIGALWQTDDAMVAAAEQMGLHLQKIHKAYNAGDAREVSRLITKPAAVLALSLGVEYPMEQALAKVWKNLVKLPVERRKVDAKLREPDEFASPAEVEEYEMRRLLEQADIAEMPTGVLIGKGAALRAGVGSKDVDWMQAASKKYGCAFFVRPRPAAAAKYRALGYNAKPMAIKFKSVDEIDAKWLGYDDYANDQGMVVLRKPKDPAAQIKDAIERGDLVENSFEHREIIKRYEMRQAEWDLVPEKLEKLNAQNGGQGFDIERDGETIRTKAVLDPDGRLVFSHNNQPVYSDIDLLHVAWPDGTALDPNVHKAIMREAGMGFDLQHGDTMSTSDFLNWEQAKEFVTDYGNAHKRGGAPLVIVQADGMSFGYVKDFSFPDQIPNGELGGMSGFGKVNVEYEGANFR